MTSDSTPVFALEKEALKTEIETGLQVGVDHLEDKPMKRKPVEKYHNTRHLLKQYDKSDRDRELLYVKDKNNSGRFGSDIQPYLKTDRALVAAICRKHNRYWIDMEHNNWWECSVSTPDGVFHDLMWVLDSDHIFAGIREVFCHMDAVLKDLGVPAGNEGSEVSS